MLKRPMHMESKADAVRAAMHHPHNAGLSKKGIRTFAIRDWKARMGNLNGRPHPSEAMPWKVWLSVTAKRRANFLKRFAARA